MTDNKKTYLKWMSPPCFLIAVLFFVFLKFLLAQILTYFLIKFFILSRFNHTSQFLYSRLMFLKSCFMVGKMCKSQLNYMVSGVLTSKNPFLVQQMQALFRIGRGERPPIPNTLSRDAQDFILKCLQVNPDNRPSAAQLLEHSYVKKLPSFLPSPASPHLAIQS